MKFIYQLLFLLLIPFYSFGQYFSVDDFKNLIDLRSTESLMYKKGLRSIEVKKKFIYTEMTKCESPKNVDCFWGCRSIGEILRKDYKLQKVPFTNYEILHKQISKFANNYNSQKKTATLFVDIAYSRTKKNTNCKNEFLYDWEKYISISFQFNDKEEGNYFKNSIIQNTEYVKTAQLGESIYVRYVYQDKNRKRSIFFDIWEYDNYISIDVNVWDYDIWSVMKDSQ
jgi:hypothetical protein